MLFNSHTFLIFLAVVLTMYYLPLPWRVKKFNLLWQSWIFYAAWNPPFVVLLWISTVVDWFAARGIHAARTPARRRLMLAFSLIANLGMLGFFKYGGFLLENFVRLMNTIGVDYHPAAPDIVLPMGISFYTFQTLSYTLDVYKGVMPPAKSFLDYALYVTFFPQLVAGPIVRAIDFLPQTLQPRRATPEQMTWGFTMMALGLFEKIVVADGLLAPIAEVVYDGAGPMSFKTAWIGTLAFGGQIFCDFAGYSTIAIGVALTMGFVLMRNFAFPFAALGFSDFWRRWHISLSTWLRDYLYIGLGGNKKGPVRTYINLMLTMLIGGLWHGAAWMYVFWGGLHGALLAVERFIRDRFKAHREPATLMGRVLFGVVTYVGINFTWVFFRSHSMPKAMSLMGSMVGLVPSGAVSPLTQLQVATVVFWTAVILAVQWSMRDTTLEAVADRFPWWARSAAVATMVIMIVLMPGEDRAFIYFQF